MRLPFFPTPFPDETLVSLFCRYHFMSGNISTTETYQQLTGIAYSWGGRNSATSLEAIAARIGPCLLMSTDELVDSLTIAPLHHWLIGKPFERKSEIMGLGQILNMSWPVRMIPDRESVSPRICPVCICKDEEMFGVAYWHREHQHCYTTICPTHGVRLLDSCPWCGSRQNIYTQLCLPSICCRWCGERADRFSGLTDDVTWFEELVSELSSSILRRNRRPSSDWTLGRAESRIGHGDPQASLVDTPEFVQFLQMLHMEIAHIDAQDEQARNCHNPRWNPFQRFRAEFLMESLRSCERPRARGYLYSWLVLGFAYRREQKTGSIMDAFGFA